MRVLHIIRDSLPSISGFTIRSKNIFRYQKKFAKIFVLTTFHFKSKRDLDIIDNIPYFRMNKRLSSFLRIYDKLVLRFINFFYKIFNINLEKRIQSLLFFPISRFTKYNIKKIIKHYDIDLIHQHSNYRIGKYSLEVAKSMKIPYIYEVRGFIEESILATARSWRLPDTKLLNLVYNRVREQETKILKEADLIITLSDVMKNELVKRQLDQNKIGIIPNCIEVNQFKKVKMDQNLRKKLNIDEELILGYFGRIRWLEGIDTLIKSIPILQKNGIDIRVILIGNIEKKYSIFLKTLINKLDLSKNVLFLGSMPQKELIHYYSIVDMIIIPRGNNKVSRIVTPIKPIEAMRFNTLVIASDLPALRYSIIDNKTGALFKPENEKDLATKVIHYYRNPDLKGEIENFASKYVKENFSWDKVIQKYKKLYQNLLSI